MPFSTVGRQAAAAGSFVCGVYYPVIQPSHTAFHALLFRLPLPASGLPKQKSGERCSRLKLPSRSNLHRASLLPAVSFLGGFQTPAGS
jgi:hypothetical protein